MYSVEDIKTEFRNKRINKKETIKRLISTIEALEDVDYISKGDEIHDYREPIDAQVEAINILRKLKLESDEVFRVLENIIVSEQVFLIKVTALKAVAELFPAKYDELLKWLSENDKEFKMLINYRCWPENYYFNICHPARFEDHYFNMLIAEIYDVIMWSNNENLRELQEIIEKETSSITQKYVLEGVNPQEAKILTVLELESYKFSKADRSLNSNISDYDFGYKIDEEGHVTEVLARFGESTDFIPNKINLLSFLEKLIIFGGSIRTIPNSVGKLERLKELTIIFNSISDLTKPRYFPENLEVLSLFNNRIKTIPESILKLKNLKTLELSANQIEGLPESFKNATNIVKFELMDNKISQIPQSLKELKSAILIDLRGNPVRRLPEYFNTLEWCSKIKVSLPPIDPLAVLPEYASKLGFDVESEVLSRKLLELEKWRFPLQDISPETILAAILYHVCKTKNHKMNGKEITQKDVSDLVGAYEICVNSEYFRLLKKLKKSSF